MDLTKKGELSKLLERYGFKNLKSLGQNFIVNPKICPKIAKAKGEGGFVLEIGPGVGTLTRELGKNSDYVLAIEKDNRLKGILSETTKGLENVEIIYKDALLVDYNQIFNTSFKKAYVCANLPYYITTKIITKFLESKLPIDKIIVMVQKEAAFRMCAPPKSNEASSISYCVRHFSNPKILFYVKRGSFYPCPKVDSAVVEFEIITPKQKVDDDIKFLKFIKTCFSKKRKFIANSIASSFSLEKQEVLKLLNIAKIPLNSRPNNLGLDDYANIYGLLGESKILGQNLT